MPYLGSIQSTQIMGSVRTGEMAPGLQSPVPDHVTVPPSVSLAFRAPWSQVLLTIFFWDQHSSLMILASHLVAGSQLVPVLKLKGGVRAVFLAAWQVEHIGCARGAHYVVKVPLPQQSDDHTLCCATDAVRCVHLGIGSE